MRSSVATRLIGFAIVAASVGLFGSLADQAQGATRCSNATFCGGWFSVCKRTIPPGGSIAVCNQRRAACLSSGCFHFNSPGPRCKSNPADLKLTTACRR